MSSKLNYVIYKIIVILLVLFFVNLAFIFFFHEVFSYPTFTVNLVIFNIFIVIDKILQQPVIYGKKEKKKEDFVKALALIILLLACPLLYSFPYLEYIYIMKSIIPRTLYLTFGILGDIIMILGGVFMCWARYIIGKEGKLIIGVEENQKLITKGPYQYVRHPIYSGIIFYILGYALSFSGIISTVGLVLFYAKWFSKRMIQEEQLLTQTFGEEYTQYMKRTKRLIPFIY